MISKFLGKYPLLEGSNFVADSATLIGDVHLGRDSSIWFNAVVRGDVNRIRIGSQTNVQDGAIVHVTNRTAPTYIGNRVSVAHAAVVHGCTVEDEVLVGIGAVILDHAVIGAQSIIGAKALVPGGVRIPPRSMVMGIPARVVRTLSDDEVESLKRNALNYVKYKNIYLGVEVPDVNPFYDPD